MLDRSHPAVTEEPLADATLGGRAFARPPAQAGAPEIRVEAAFGRAGIEVALDADVADQRQRAPEVVTALESGALVAVRQRILELGVLPVVEDARRDPGLGVRRAEAHPGRLVDRVLVEPEAHDRVAAALVEIPGAAIAVERRCLPVAETTLEHGTDARRGDVGQVAGPEDAQAAVIQAEPRVDDGIGITRLATQVEPLGDRIPLPVRGEALGDVVEVTVFPGPADQLVVDHADRRRGRVRRVEAGRQLEAGHVHLRLAVLDQGEVRHVLHGSRDSRLEEQPGRQVLPRVGARPGRAPPLWARRRLGLGNGSLPEAGQERDCDGTRNAASESALPRVDDPDHAPPLAGCPPGPVLSLPR